MSATGPDVAQGGTVAVVARTPDHLDVFWVNPDGSIGSTWWDQDADGGAWDPARVFAATGPDVAQGGTVAVVARTPDHLDVFWVNPDGSIGSTWWDQDADGGAWDPARVFAATGPDVAQGGTVAVVARTPDHLDVFWVNPDGSIGSTWWDQDADGGAWDPARVFAATGPDVAQGGTVAVVARTPDHLDVFWVNPDGSIGSTWWDQDADGGAWDPARVFAATGPDVAQPGRSERTACIHSPAIAASSDGRLEVFAVGADGGLWHTWQTALSNGWNGPPILHGHPAGTALVGSPAIAASSDGRLEVFAVGADGGLWHTWQTALSNGWNGPPILHGHPAGTALVGSPAIAASSDGRLEVFAVGADGGLWHTWQTALSNGWNGPPILHGHPAGTALVGSPAIAASSDGRLEVFAVGADGGLWHTWQTALSNGWNGPPILHGHPAGTGLLPFLA